MSITFEYMTECFKILRGQIDKMSIVHVDTVIVTSERQSSVVAIIIPVRKATLSHIPVAYQSGPHSWSILTREHQLLE